MDIISEMTAENQPTQRSHISALSGKAQVSEQNTYRDAVNIEILSPRNVKKPLPSIPGKTEDDIESTIQSNPSCEDLILEGHLDIWLKIMVNLIKFIDTMDIQFQCHSFTKNLNMKDLQQVHMSTSTSPVVERDTPSDLALLAKISF